MVFQNQAEADCALALDYANQVLADLGQPEIDALPAGTPGSVVACSLARAFWHIAAPGDVRASGLLMITLPTGTMRMWSVPRGVQNFMRAYDQRRYPDLIQANEPQLLAA